jgi:hypothetical protein
MLTRIRLRDRLLAGLTTIDEPERSQIVDEIVEHYSAPGPKASRWRVARAVQYTEPDQRAVSVVERTDESTEACIVGGLDHEKKAEAVADALNAIEAEVRVAPPLTPRT